MVCKEKAIATGTMQARPCKHREYQKRIASYILYNFENRGIKVYLEVELGKTIIGKNRRIDIFVFNEPLNQALALECKYQDTGGTADEKIPYTLQDLEALHFPGFLVYAGEGFSKGIIHLLEGSSQAAYCLPDASFNQNSHTRELDSILAAVFDWWDLVLWDKKPFSLEPDSAQFSLFDNQNRS